ncbi:MAG: SulP family inorganic anion transporter [Planctomycetota bacterium]
MATVTSDVPKTGLAGLAQNWRADLLSGFLVFLIALPLCLGISLACGYPAIAGIFTAIVGGIVATFVSNSELTIKGPAAGLIVIVVGCVQGFGHTGGQDPAMDMQAYKLALGVGVVAAALQIVFGLIRAGVVGDFFPSSAVHGMLAAIGIIIGAKQIHIALGVSPAAKEPLHLIAEIPHSIMHLNPDVAAIGILSLVILFGLNLVKNKYLKMIPAQMLVILVTVPLGIYFDLDHQHTYSIYGHEYELGPKFLVNVPNNMFSAITFPDFSGILTRNGIQFIIMFALIGTLESVLSAKAIDLIDPWKRKTNLDRDTIAIGIGNLLAALIGGLPMISEIVRSKANIDNGARTRFANMFHSMFLLLFVALVPGLIHKIPLAALAAMLVFTGYRLASPREFLNVYKIGREQLIIFVTTVVAVLATDLLIGIGIGIAAKVLIHLLNGAPIRCLFRPDVAVEQRDENTIEVVVRDAAVFSNWIALRRQIEGVLINYDGVQEVILQLSQTRLVDHTVMEKLHELEQDFAQRNCKLSIRGLENHRGLSTHPHAARKKAASIA